MATSSVHKRRLPSSFDIGRQAPLPPILEQCGSDFSLAGLTMEEETDMVPETSPTAIQDAGGCSTTSLVRRVIPQVKELLEQLPLQHRAVGHSLWNLLRNVIDQTEEERNRALTEQQFAEEQMQIALASNALLQQQKSALQDEYDDLETAYAMESDPAPTRPPSASNDWTNMRARNCDIMNEAVEQFVALGITSDEAISLSRLPVEWATTKLEAKRDFGVEATDWRCRELGCWMASPQKGNNYTKINLKHTRHPIDMTVKMSNVFAHHLAVVADGRGVDLLVVSAGKPPRSHGELVHRNVSHLCNNARCFRPGHCRVESTAVNVSRSACAESVITKCPCNRRYQPCVHRDMEGSCGEYCILPKRTPSEPLGDKFHHFCAVRSQQGWMKEY